MNCVIKIDSPLTPPRCCVIWQALAHSDLTWVAGSGTVILYGWQALAHFNISSMRGRLCPTLTLVLCVAGSGPL